jgi:hypothetical protein
VKTNETEPSLSIKEMIDTELALSGFHRERLLHLQFACIQRKMLVYVDRLDRMKDVAVFSNYLSMARVRKNGALL